MYRLFFTDTAKLDFKESANFYEDKSIGLGERFTTAVEKKLSIIREFPERYPKRYSNFRETVLKDFPFTIVYSFYKTTKEIHVSAIYHTSRNPNKKFRGNQ